MAVKFLYYFVFAFIGITIFLLYQKPYTVVIDANAQKKADIEMLNIVNYAISSNGISRIIKSDKVLRYKDHDEFYNIDSIRKQKENYHETLLANSGRLEQNILNLYGNIRYENSNGSNPKKRSIICSLRYLKQMWILFYKIVEQLHMELH